MKLTDNNVLTGFDNKQNQEEDTETINAGIAKYDTAPEFLDIYAQVGAVYSSYNHNIAEIEEKSSKGTLEKLNQALLMLVYIALY